MTSAAFYVGMNFASNLLVRDHSCADFKVSLCLGDERLEEARFKSSACGECTCKAPVLENVQACACGEFISFLVSR